MSGTMAEKVWRDHIVSKGENGAPDLLYIDLHLVHEVTSPQAFEGLRLAGRKVRVSATAPCGCPSARPAPPSTRPWAPGTAPRSP